MVAWIIGVVRLLIVLVGQHRSLALENLALRTSWRSIGAHGRSP